MLDTYTVVHYVVSMLTTNHKERGMNFTIQIESGNTAMQTPEDVAEALRKAADKITQGGEDGTIRDANGNTVGFWQFLS